MAITKFYEKLIFQTYKRTIEENDYGQNDLGRTEIWAQRNGAEQETGQNDAVSTEMKPLK